MNKYQVWEYKNGVGHIVRYEVAQESQGKQRSPITTFPVSDRYDKEIQQRRAHDYCGYMNKLVEAEKVAYEQNQLVNILKA